MLVSCAELFVQVASQVMKKYWFASGAARVLEECCDSNVRNMLRTQCYNAIVSVPLLQVPQGDQLHDDVVQHMMLQFIRTGDYRFIAENHSRRMFCELHVRNCTVRNNTVTCFTQPPL